MKSQSFSMPRPFWICSALLGLPLAVLAAPELMIADFNLAESALTWRTVNDDVMGGVSTSRFKVGDDGMARFRGELSLENNGGFASIRSSGALPDLAGLETIVVRVKGDGRRYQLRVRTDSGVRAADYRAEFQTKKGEWEEHRLQLADFVPTWRGRILEGVPPIDPARLQSIGFLLADQQPGPFELEIDWIKAIPGGEQKTGP